MKYKNLYIIFLFAFVNVQAQIEQNFAIIDSLQQALIESNSNDSIFIARQHYKIGHVLRKSSLSDSAYYYFQLAERVFRQNNLNYELAITLYGIANCQRNNKDYTGSEVTSIESITLLNELEENNDVRKHKAFNYNNLGIIFNELGQFEESIRYHTVALDLKKSLEGDFESSIGSSINNMGYVYKNMGEYDLAKTQFEKILENKSLFKKDPGLHVLALGNYANTLFLSKDYSQLPKLYHNTLKLCDSLGQEYHSIIIHQYLAEFYKLKEQKDSALYYAYKAKELSEKYNNDDLLKSLLILSEIEGQDKSFQFLKRYRVLSDSLYKVERAVQNKFARIRFETQEIEQKNERIEQENKQIAKERQWLFIISIVLILSSILLYLFIHQRNKNRELQFIQQQQEANEEIYNLMLSQNESVEEARALEKKRISQELHDGVLGRLFGTRLSLDSLNMNTSVEAVKTRSQYIDELKTIEQDIRKVSHELNTDFVSGGGFVDILKTLVETQSIAYKLNYTLDYDEVINWEAISNKKKIHIYRIVQESLHNIYKHANAQNVEISFKLKNDVICLTIEDDGSGFDTSKAKSGIGLKNMTSRINEINGRIHFSSEIGKGTKVSIEVPIQ